MALTPANPTSTLPARRHAQLPPLIRDYLERTLPTGAPDPAQVRITQSGTMWTKPGGRAMPFTATERFAVERIAFRWEARFRIAPAVAVRVRDGYDGEHGELAVRALGIPLQRRSGPDIAGAEAYRYLAELPWVPHAMAANPELEWTQLDDRSVEVSCRVHDERIAVALGFDARGDIFRSTAAARPRDAGGQTIPTPWGGDLGDYRTLGGIRMPTRGEVYWQLPEGRFVYWKGRITSAAPVQERFAPAGSR